MVLKLICNYNVIFLYKDHFIFCTIKENACILSSCKLIPLLYLLFMFLFLSPDHDFNDNSILINCCHNCILKHRWIFLTILPTFYSSSKFGERCVRKVYALVIVCFWGPWFKFLFRRIFASNFPVTEFTVNICVLEQNNN